MKKKLLSVFIPLLLIGALLGVGFNYSQFEGDGDTVTKEKLLKQLLFMGLEKVHYEPKKIDDSFSEASFKEYFKQTDPNKRFYLESDIEQLSAYKDQIDEDINFGNVPFLDNAEEIYKRRTEEIKKYTEEILSSPFDFSIEEDFETSSDKRAYAKNSEELRERWRKFLKYAVLTRYAGRIEDQNKAKETAEKEGKDFEEKSLETIEKEARESIKKNYDDYFVRLDRMTRDKRVANYLNAAISTYDPHTSYFPPKDKQDFDIGMSGQLEGIGASLTQTEGEVKVVRIVPGSPSWKQGELKEEDIIIKVAQGEEEPVSIEDMLLDDAIKLIRGKKGTEVKLTVRKPDGRITVIPIIRDVVVFEESYVKSAISITPEGKKVGIINLPSFYVNFNQAGGGRRCATDVERELLRLKAENVEGIVFDLRNNGGGSLQDVIEMVGLFVGEGPVVQVKGRNDEIEVHTAPARPAIYDGPLVVMVNRLSASATEIFSAAMQDYGRAIVVGAQTYGKGSVQRFIDLDFLLNDYYADYKPLGSLKLTIQKYYRINGGATQVEGVKPDITIPDIYSYMDVGEGKLPYVLPWDEIKSAEYKTWNKDKYDLKSLDKKSQKRQKENPFFEELVRGGEQLAAERENTLQSLNYKKYADRQEKLKEESDKLEKFQEKLEGYEFTILKDPQSKEFSATSEQEKEEFAKIQKESEDRWKESLEKDDYIQEATNILIDIL
ncbi:carboxy terminal-processing peptidase [Sediminitomix flava]|uniref:Carboxyl-terminal processing protease n=1 Tax=Sediminitomix flava TaxID=379075 RepID=A0A315ZEX9_SEDFL|nr:carboxy terminal-processing peptidase [Sediminitomix flava]PWJ43709.1 carboxyl-terminal processing protease [Sediminitomix flava]